MFRDTSSCGITATAIKLGKRRLNEGELTTFLLIRFLMKFQVK
jgi:hypothetical protein